MKYYNFTPWTRISYNHDWDAYDIHKRFVWIQFSRGSPEKKSKNTSNSAIKTYNTVYFAIGGAWGMATSFSFKIVVIWIISCFFVVKSLLK